MKKQYKAIFFDWDGTAVLSRKAPVDEAVSAMKKLLKKGIKLIIVSGTTYENIAGGKLHSYFSEEELDNLYLGLGRGAFNYCYVKGEPHIFADCIPDKEGLLQIHDICYEIHRQLLLKYDFPTDIVFGRPNYCKIDIMTTNERGDQLFMQESELDIVRENLRKHGMAGGLKDLLALSEEIGEAKGVKVAATCDAKYLEVGISDKSHNTKTIFTKLNREFGIQESECAFWGDEFVGLEEGIFGSDSFMVTELTRGGDFFDVSEVTGARPAKVQVTGGGTGRFLGFLKEQAKLEA